MTIPEIFTGPQANILPDKKRLHLQNGPIDLIIEAIGEPEVVASAYLQAVRAFDDLLDDLVTELDDLRQPCARLSNVPKGQVARAMWEATTVHCEKTFITPMAAVAGAVADYVLENLIAGQNLTRAYVNNGGDIALYLAEKQSFKTGICTNPQTGEHTSTITIHSTDNINGIATSGWRGRSHSLGIADAVTVLAKNAATADAVATLVANEVNLDNSHKITRAPARDLSPDSDLGDQLVTQAVGDLSDTEIKTALHAGQKLAQNMVEAGHARAIYLNLKGQTEIVASPQTSIAMPPPKPDQQNPEMTGV